MTVYLGAGDKGIRLNAAIEEAARRRNMKKSEFILSCVKRVLNEERSK
jgi:hypothetical protein